MSKSSIQLSDDAPTVRRADLHIATTAQFLALSV